MKPFCQFVLTSALLAATPAAAEMSPNETAITEVIEHHLAAFAERDTDELMKDYADDIVFVYSGTIIQGAAAMRQAFESHFATPGQNAPEMSIGKVEGDVGVVHWILNRGEPDATQGADVFVIRDRKIHFQTNTNVDPLSVSP